MKCRRTGRVRLRRQDFMPSAIIYMEPVILTRLQASKERSLSLPVYSVPSFHSRARTVSLLRRRRHRHHHHHHHYSSSLYRGYRCATSLPAAEL